VQHVLQQNTPQMLEPIMDINLRVPNQYVGWLQKKYIRVSERTTSYLWMLMVFRNNLGTPAILILKQKSTDEFLVGYSNHQAITKAVDN
jgi:hypothetical protein